MGMEGAELVSVALHTQTDGMIGKGEKESERESGDKSVRAHSDCII